MMHLNSLFPTSFAGNPPVRQASEISSARQLAGINLEISLLVIEDEAMIAWMVESMLEEMGFGTIEIAPTGDEAVRLARATPPDLVISDINLGSSLDGIAATAAIRTVTPGPVIFITGYASAEACARIEADLKGAIVLRKPVSEPELRAAILQALAPRTN